MRGFILYRLSALILITTVIQPVVGAKDVVPPPSVLLVYPHNLGGDDTNDYSPIISGFIAAELASKGISAQVADKVLDLSIDGGTPKINVLSPLLNFGEKSGHEFVILCIFSELGGNMELFFHVIDVDAGEIALSIEKQTSPLLMIDLAISRSMDLIMEKLSDRMYAAQAERPAEQTTPDETEAIMPVSPPVTMSKVPARGFAVSAGIGSIVFLGSAADYLRSGLTATVSGKYGLPFLSGRFDFGVYAGGFFAEPRESIAEGSVIISPAGILLDFISTTGSFLEVSFSVCGGMSVIAARIEEQEYLTKTVPFASGGPGFITFANSRVSVQVDVLLNVFFESQQVIFGYMPNLRILLR